MSKEGLFTSEEAKFFGKIIAGAIPTKAVWKPVLSWVIPTMLDTADNKMGDRIPEPWQSIVENLITMVYDALQDKVVTPEEEAAILEFCANVINEKVDIPWFEEDDEAVIFVSAIQFLAATVRKAIKGAKA
jgi:hypothetical protein